MADDERVDGLAPGRVIVPTKESDIAEILRDGEESDWILPIGGATALSTGNVVSRVPVSMELTSLTGVREYEPTDLTVSVRAGMRWSELIDTLGEHGQTIPVDIPLPQQATVGGVVATGWAGPRRLRDGTMKDLLIGASFVRGDGLMAKAGGMVVKNVSGFEIPRLLHGSYGNLAVITSVNLKVIPRQEAELTLQSTPMPMIQALEHVLQVTRTQPSIAAAVVDGTGESGTIAIRLSGREKPIRQLAASIREGFDGELAPEMDHAGSERFWQERSDRLATTAGDSVTIEVGCAPSTAAVTMSHLRDEYQGGRFSVSPGTGSIVVMFPPEMVTLGDWVKHWQERGLDRTASYLILHAPAAWRDGIDVWSIPEQQRAMMMALKQQFDPGARLNRGRLWDASMPSVMAGVGSRS